jgi:uncharacterized protein YbaP (TraB family)
MRNALFAIGLSLFGTLSAAAAAEDSAPINATPAMWVVHGPKGTAYLLGSIHVLPKNVNWQTPEIAAAMKRADTFVFEVPMDADSKAIASTSFQNDTYLPVEVSLPSFFDQEMRDEYRDVVFRIHGNAEGLVYLRPWVAAMVLQGQADGSLDMKGFVSEEGVDNKVYAEAEARGVKRFRAFETWDSHVHLLTGDGDLDEGLSALRQTFKRLLSQPGDQTLSERMFDAWRKGDTKASAAIGPDGSAMTPAGRKAMLDDRNQAWIPQIVAMLNEKHTYFITVGCFHLVGKGGVPNLLRAKGYRVDGPSD